MSERRIDSSDDHLDMNAMPRDAWVSRLPKKYREGGPRVVEKKGKSVWLLNDEVISISGRFEGFDSAIDRIENHDPDGLRAGVPKLRLEDMDHDGIYSSIIYGPNALTGYQIADPEQKIAVMRAWNDWSAEEFNAHAPDRMSALPMLPTTSPADAVAELERVVGLGHRGAIFHCFEVDLMDRAWDALWSALEETGVPLSFHIGGGTKLNPSDLKQRALFAAIVPMQMDEPLATMIYTGALERHPRLQLVLAESGVGWLPYFVARMDETFKKHCLPFPGKTITTLPSEQFKRQVYATFEEEPLGPSLMPLLSEDNFMWACDYPHPDSTWPNSAAAIDHSLGTLGEEAVRKVTSATCRRLYALS